MRRALLSVGSPAWYRIYTTQSPFRYSPIYYDMWRLTINDTLREGQILTGPLFSEPVRVVTVRSNGVGSIEAGLVGQRTEVFRQVTLTSADIAALAIADTTLSYDGEGHLLRLGLQAYSLAIAYEFDPYFGLSISRVDPLPHQLEAVYDYLLKLPSVRFLLADDAGAGKTIMAGLLIRELKLRGLAERVLVVCPANLTFQWQRELKEKFDERFLVLKGGDIRDQFGVNQWLEQKQTITSLDLAKRQDILPGLRQVHWDLVIVDEAHRMSARDDTHKSQRYRLGELLRDSTDNMLLLTATPHKGDPHNFTLFLQLLDQDAYADVKSIREAMERRRAPFYLRRTKEAMVYFPERQEDGSWAAKPVFTKRITNTAGFTMGRGRVRPVPSGHPLREAPERPRCVPRRRPAGARRRLPHVVVPATAGLQRSRHETVPGKPGQQAGRRPQTSPRPGSDSPRPTLIGMTSKNWKTRSESAWSVCLKQSRSPVTPMIHARRLPTSDNSQHRPQPSKQWATKPSSRASTKSCASRDSSTTPTNGCSSSPNSKDTLDYLVDTLKSLGFRVGSIHGGMKPGSRDEPGSRLYTEQQFRDGHIQVLVATEAAGEGNQPAMLPHPVQLRHPLEPEQARTAHGPHPPLRTTLRLPHLQFRRHQHHRRKGAPTPVGQAPRNS